MNNYLCAFLIVLISIINNTATANNSNDSINSTINLSELIVEAKNITRVDDYLLILPTSEQKKHSFNGYDLLSSIMIPGLNVNAQSGNVDMLGIGVGIYINGLPCDKTDIKMLRPKDVEKIEFFDAPKGKYSNNYIAINFVVKQYNYGGYTQIEGTQTIGYTQGNYNIASSINSKNLTYSVFAGVNYANIKGNTQHKSESYQLNPIVNRTIDTEISQKNNNEYVQFRTQWKTKKHYLNAKLSLIHNSIPNNASLGTICDSLSQLNNSSSSHMNNLSPSLNINGQIQFDDSKLILYQFNGQYSKNKYEREYIENNYTNNTYQTEDAGLFDCGITYQHNFSNGTFSTQLFDFYKIFDANYSGNNFQKHNLWRNSLIGFVGYNHSFTKRFSLQARVGFDWNIYQNQHSSVNKFLNPRFNLTLTQRIKNGMLSGYFMLANSNYGSNIINNSLVEINPYMIMAGNPNLKKSYDTNTYIYYQGQFGKFNVSGITQYAYNYNPVITNYSIDNSINKIIKSYSNNGNNQYASIICGLTYNISKKISLTGDIRYAHTQINIENNRWFNNELTGNISGKCYLGNFSIAPAINFSTKKLNRQNAIVTTAPISYSIKATYINRNFYASVYINNPFHKRITKSYLKTDCYYFDSEYSNQTSCQYCNISLAYSFDFGYKTEKIKKDINTDINSSLLQIN